MVSPGKIKPQGHCVQVPTLEGRRWPVARGTQGKEELQEGLGWQSSLPEKISSYLPATCKQNVCFLCLGFAFCVSWR